MDVIEKKLSQAQIVPLNKECTSNNNNNNNNTNNQNNNSNNPKVKLCGYLKKKRNKVGGWRKMWFVLQDKLLLSYSSKEDYDNKLVSFKDVLNLVPGTLVRPLEGFRFTIETTSQALYTFHCDDGNDVYREWITMLVDSLATTQALCSGASTSIQKFSQRFCNISLDNIPNVLRSNNSKPRRDITQSYDSLSYVADYLVPHQAQQLQQQQKEQQTLTSSSIAAASCVRLPIAHNTAKILERNGVSSVDFQMICNRKISENMCCKRNPYSNCDEIYCTCATDIANETTYQDALTSTGLTCRILGPKSITEKKQKEIHGEKSAHHRPQDTLNKFDGFRNCIECHANGNRLDDKNIFSSWENLCDNATYSYANQSKQIGIVKNKIHRMSIKGAKELITEESDHSTAEQKHTKVTTTATNVEQLIMQKENPLIASKIQNLPKEFEVLSTNLSVANSLAKEPIYAVVDLKSKYALRKMRNRHAELKRCNSYDSIIHAATDLYKMHRKEKSSSLIEDDIDGIYEDGDMFCSKANRELPTLTVEEENIYEPINVPPPPLPHISTHPKAIWKYFTRLKVNLTRIRKRGSDYDSIKLPKKSPPKKEPSSSHFSTIKHKFGTHRKSMQVQVRKLCARAYEPRPFFSHTNANKQQNNNTTNTVSNNNSAKKPKKYYWKSVKIKPKKLNCYSETTKVEKRIFGSLPHIRVRKVRSSILDANVSKQVESNCSEFERGEVL